MSYKPSGSYQVLQCYKVCCIVLQCSRSVQKCSAVYQSVLQYSEVFCSVLQCSEVFCCVSETIQSVLKDGRYEAIVPKDELHYNFNLILEKSSYNHIIQKK